MMSISELKIQLHERIDHLSEGQLKKLYRMLSKAFPKDVNPQKRELGTLPGLIKYMAPDFDESLEDFKEYMPELPI